ncbi:MAG: hypothetical protein UY63_C0011G0024 [Parcubacteria group bacterium GW2011_GWA2_51_10]|nr:MAG: hypothetical protein UY63_C0011G0024 [Parcubacteria group bacterium GW2011_GWA2_51_10]
MTLCAEDLVMRSDCDEPHHVGIFVEVNRTIVAGYVNAPTACVWFMQQMIIEDWIIGVCQEDIAAFFKLVAQFVRKTRKLFLKLPM